MPLTHQEIDARSLALHRLMAEKIRRDPVLFEKAKATLARWRRMGDGGSRAYDREWARLMDEGLEPTLRLATEDSPRAAALRQSSPFAGVLTPRERTAFLKQWRQAHAP